MSAGGPWRSLPPGSEVELRPAPEIDLDVPDQTPQRGQPLSAAWRRLLLASAVVLVVAAAVGSSVGARAAEQSLAATDEPRAVSDLSVPNLSDVQLPASDTVRLRLAVTNLGDRPLRVLSATGRVGGLGELTLDEPGVVVAAGSRVELGASTTLDCRRQPRPTGYRLRVGYDGAPARELEVTVRGVVEREVCALVSQRERTTNPDLAVRGVLEPRSTDTALPTLEVLGAAIADDRLELTVRLPGPELEVIGIRVDGSAMPLIGQQRSGDVAELTLDRPIANCRALGDRAAVSAAVSLAVSGEWGVRRLDAPVGPALTRWLVEGYLRECG